MRVIILGTFYWQVAKRVTILAMGGNSENDNQHVTAADVVNAVTRQYPTLNAMIQAHSREEPHSFTGEMLQFAILTHCFVRLKRHNNDREFLRPIQAEIANSWNRLSVLTDEASP